MVALVGDAEMDEGNIFEALMEGWKHGLRRTWWIIDYNRQSLDAVIREGLYSRFEEIIKSFGWDVRRPEVRMPDGCGLRRTRRRAPAPVDRYRAEPALCGADVPGRRRMAQTPETRTSPTMPTLLALVARRDDEQLASLMGNLGGHDMVNLLKAFEDADNDRPTVFIAYTVKGYGLPLAGHKDNHSGLLTPAQTELFRDKVGVRAGRGMGALRRGGRAGSGSPPLHRGVPVLLAGPRRYSAPKLPVPQDFPCPRQPSLSTQAGFGLILKRTRQDGYAARGAHRHHLAGRDGLHQSRRWVNRRGLFAKQEMRDLFKSERIPSTFNWDFSTKGQHMELGIAEMNLFLLLSALGLSDRLSANG